MNKYLGHILAFTVISIWGVTFISSKILLKVYSPLEILLLRFILGYFTLWILKPKRPPKIGWRLEIKCILAGLTGVCIYYFLENQAMVYTYASNVSIIMAAAPFFIAVASIIFLKDRTCINRFYFIGFLIAMTGVCLISYNGSLLELNPLGDGLALIACISWAFYSILVEQLNKTEYPVVLITRRIFIYGNIFIFIGLKISGHSLDLSPLKEPVYLANILFLGILASAICFAVWNYAIKLLGPVESGVYIYLGPIVTVIASSLILKEQITLLCLVGTLLIILGLICSEQGKNIYERLKLK